MRKVIAISASNNTGSINDALLQEAIWKISGAEVELIRFTGLSLPVYSARVEREAGIPPFIRGLAKAFASADGFMIASPEYNGLPPACFKNVIDWLSRLNQKIFGGKPVLLLSTSPGANGGASNLKIISALLPRWGGEFAGAYSLGDFYHSFDRAGMKVIDPVEEKRLSLLVEAFEHRLFETIERTPA